LMPVLIGTVESMRQACSGRIVPVFKYGVAGYKPRMFGSLIVLYF